MSVEIQISNLSRPGGLPIRARWCDSFSCRLRGLMFRQVLASDEGLLIVQEKDSRIDSSIHMLFMKMDLAVVWINSALTVVDVQLAKRWKLAVFSKAPARYVLELPASAQILYSIGDQVRFEPLHTQN
jgi:uncharacterized membrane protein (UPF0127 family)